MRCRLFIVFLAFCLNTPVLQAFVAMDEHHSSSSSLHDHYHDVGQPHVHDQTDVEDFEINYSTEAYEHSNPLHDVSVVGVVETLVLSYKQNHSDPVISMRMCTWDPPFLKHINPPPIA